MQKHYNGLTGLRGVGAMGVIAYHVYIIGGFSGCSYIADRTIGNLGAFVQLFFILSGFGLMCSYHEQFSKQIECEGFYKRRLEKIAPTFWFALLATCILYIIVGVKIDFRNVIATFSLLFYFFPQYQESVVAAGWTLGVEVVFYLIFPLLFLCSKTKKRCLITFCASVLLYCAYNSIPKAEGSLAHINVIYQLPFFVLGMLLYFFIDTFENFKGKGRVAFYALTLVVYILCYIFYQKYSFICLVVALSILILNQIGFNDRIINNPVFCFLGKISYPMYLFHMIVYSALYNLHIFEKTSCLNPKLAFIINYSLVLGLTVLCSFLYQRISVKLRRLIKTVQEKK